MALATYFSKNLLAISSIVKGGSVEEFERALNASNVAVAFDADVETHEGYAALDLLIRMLSRLYPRMRIIDLTGNKEELVNQLTRTARAINSRIELSDDHPTVALVLGKCRLPEELSKIPTFYAGSNGWVAKGSTEAPVGFGTTSLPFAAGIAACIGAANVFRSVFQQYIPKVTFDDNYQLSLVDMKVASELSPMLTGNLQLGDITLAGAGAVGNGAVWALSMTKDIIGHLTIVDPEPIEKTNLQRYILVDEGDIKKSKVEIMRNVLETKSITVDAKQMDWSSFQSETDYRSNTSVLVAIDNIPDRLAIQSSLPFKIFNAYTENNLCGISRHRLFGEEACLMCINMPLEQRRSYSQEVADNLGVGQHEELIRSYLHYNKAVDHRLIEVLARENIVSIDSLTQFLGLPMADFYANAVCGGTFLQISGVTKAGSIEAPMAFQSAMAGILLVSELVIEQAGLRTAPLPSQTHFSPLFSVKNDMNPRSMTAQKDQTGRCICHDKDFTATFNDMWVQTS